MSVPQCRGPLPASMVTQKPGGSSGGSPVLQRSRGMPGSPQPQARGLSDQGRSGCASQTLITAGALEGSHVGFSNVALNASSAFSSVSSRPLADDPSTAHSIATLRDRHVIGASIFIAGNEQFDTDACGGRTLILLGDHATAIDNASVLR
jgi:hypothetical protein